MSTSGGYVVVSVGGGADEGTPLIPASAKGSVGGAASAHQNGKGAEEAPLTAAPPASSAENGSGSSWKEMMGLVLPFLLPEGGRHTLLAGLALTFVVAGKVVAVLPPLAIRAAVDVIGDAALEP